jgi:hypothetical protein
LFDKKKVKKKVVFIFDTNFKQRDRDRDRESTTNKRFNKTSKDESTFWRIDSFHDIHTSW